MQEKPTLTSQKEIQERVKKLASLTIESTFAVRALLQNPEAIMRTLSVLEKKYGPQLAEMEKDKRDLSLKEMNSDQITQFKEDMAGEQETESFFSPEETAELEKAIDRATQ